jgi:hypothetical protein
LVTVPTTAGDESSAGVHSVEGLEVGAGRRQLDRYQSRRKVFDRIQAVDVDGGRRPYLQFSTSPRLKHFASIDALPKICPPVAPSPPFVASHLLGAEAAHGDEDIGIGTEPYYRQRGGLADSGPGAARAQQSDGGRSWHRLQAYAS